MSESRFFSISSKGRFTCLTTLEEALAARVRGTYIWLDYLDPTREELERLLEPLDLHPLALEDCLDDGQVPKMEDFSKNNFILFNRFAYVDHILVVHEVNLFLGQDYVVSVNHGGADARAFYDRLDEHIQNAMVDVKRGTEFLVHVILDYVVDHKYRAIELLQDELDEAEDAILISPRSYRPEGLMQLRRALVVLRKSLFHEREILVKICRRDSLFIDEKAIYHFRDIYDHLTKFYELTEVYRETITSLMEMYLSMINNEMARISNRTSTTMHRLTLITTLFMPLTLLAGIGGMSEWSMMTGPDNWKVSYPLFLLGMVGIGALSLLLLKLIERRGDGPG
jgi:magnesium transporter